ncbi:uncharacterized protein AB675_7296 [Cyphellophora attinorum]|uniref:Uncharacterized protein n=1 Tax=Cyphellophora attinorum TaxID=1664694 RepID=A0A0N1NX21_9EURO|nr:uncharacterized protein AB675_7296 [Phialophora attinorum]KPI36296.1 hypothetical protein AB675_7296 [Phialophora attinorum]
MPHKDSKTPLAMWPGSPKSACHGSCRRYINSVRAPRRRNYIPFKRRFPFLLLPAEVRDTIYRYIFWGTQLARVECIDRYHISALCLDNAGGWRKGTNMGLRAPYTAILFVSKLCLQEARFRLFSEARLRINNGTVGLSSSPGLPLTIAPRDLISYRLSANAEEFETLSHVSLVLDYRRGHGLATICSLVASMPNWTSVAMHVGPLRVGGNAGDSWYVHNNSEGFWYTDDAIPTASQITTLASAVGRSFEQFSPSGLVATAWKTITERSGTMVVAYDVAGRTEGHAQADYTWLVTVDMKSRAINVQLKERSMPGQDISPGSDIAQVSTEAVARLSHPSH